MWACNLKYCTSSFKENIPYKWYLPIDGMRIYGCGCQRKKRGGVLKIEGLAMVLNHSLTTYNECRGNDTFMKGLPNVNILLYLIFS